MKTKYKIAALQLALLVIIAACQKDDAIYYPQALKFPSLNWPNKTNDIDTIKLMVVGTYDWVRTEVSNRTGTKYTDPDTERKTYKYVFRPDSIVELYEDGKFKWSNKYVVDYEMPIAILPSAGTVISIIDKSTSNTLEYFYPFLSNDSAAFSNPGSNPAARYFSRQ